VSKASSQLPFSLALFTGSFHRVLDPVRIVDMLELGKSLGAHRTVGNRIRVSFHVNDNTILDRHQDTAAAVAAFAGGLYDFLFAHSV
jgi:hypothetical protein